MFLRDLSNGEPAEKHSMHCQRLWRRNSLISAILQLSGHAWGETIDVNKVFTFFYFGHVFTFF